MSAATHAREDARQEARGRLVEVLAELVPGFRPDRAFHCLSPDHEDRHPSARYLSRTHTVKCFSCGWSGDVFDVAGAVYGLAGGDRFRKVYDLLGIDARGGRAVRSSRPAKPADSKRDPGAVDDLRAIIYPPGWNDPAPEPELPVQLATIAGVEKALAGILARHPEDAAICQECGLEEWHFDDGEIGEFYGDLCAGIAFANTCTEFVAWLKDNAVPRHMLRRLSRFIINEGRRWELEATLAAAFTHFQNEESPHEVLDDIFNEAELITGDRYDLPKMDGADMRHCLAKVFDRWLADDDPRQIIAEYRRPAAARVGPVGRTGLNYG